MARSELKMENYLKFKLHTQLLTLNSPNSTLQTQLLTLLQSEQEEQLPQHSPFFALFIVLISAVTNAAATMHNKIISIILILHHSYQKSAQMNQQGGKPCHNALPHHNCSCPLYSKLSFYRGNSGNTWSIKQ